MRTVTKSERRRERVYRIRYIEKIKKRGPFGIPYTAIVVRTAHVDECNWQRLRRRPFSLSELLIY